MSSHLPPTRTRRRSAAARGGVVSTALMCAALLCTAGCGAGFNAASLDVKPDLGYGQVGGIRVNGVVVVTDPASGNAEIIAAVANTGTDPEQLVSVTAAGLPATVRPADAVLAAIQPGEPAMVAGNTVTIPGGSAVSFGQPGRPELEIADGAFTPGHFAQVELGFANAGQATVNALTMSNTGLYADYNPNGPNTPSATNSPSPSASATPSSTPSSTLSPSVSPISTPSAGAAAPAKASTTLVRAPHLHGSREPLS